MNKKKKQNKFVSTNDFEKDIEMAKSKYIQMAQFIKQNPKKIESIRDLIGIEFDAWLFIYETRKDLLKKRENQLKTICINNSIKDIFIAYSNYVKTYLVNTPPPRVFVYVNTFIKDVMRYNKKNYSLRMINDSSSLLECIKKEEETFAELNSLQDKINLYVDNEVSYEIFYEKKFFITEDNLKKLKFLYKGQEFLLRAELNKYEDYLRAQVWHLDESQPLDFNNRASLASTMIKDRFDPQYKFLTKDYIYKEVAFYYFLIDSFFPVIEKIQKINNSYNDDLIRFEYSQLLSFFKIFMDMNKVNSSLNKNPLQTLLIDLDNYKEDNSLLNYAFFKIGDTVYTNKRMLYNINMADHLFTHYWMKADIQEKRNFSANHEKVMTKFLTDYKFKAKCNVKYRKDNQQYEIDIIAKDERSIIFCEIKTTNVKDNYYDIKKNIKGNLCKAIYQLSRLKQHINDLEVQNQLDLSKNEISEKEIFYVIYSMTPDGVGQIDDFPYLNFYLFDILLQNYCTDQNLTLKQAYNDILIGLDKIL